MINGRSKILIVPDKQVNISSIKTILSNQNFEILSTDNLSEAMDILKKET